MKETRNAELGTRRQAETPEGFRVPGAGFRVLIVGYGNPLRSDDGLGWVAVERFSRGDEHPLVETLTTQQLTPELAETISHFGRVLFVDASIEGRPGELHCDPVSPAGDVPSSMTHHVTPPVLLALSQALYGACPQAWLVSITAASLEAGDKLSPIVEAQVPALLGWLAGLVAG